MQDWKQTRKDINTRLVELNGLSPETMKGTQPGDEIGSRQPIRGNKIQEVSDKRLEPLTWPSA